MALRFWGFPRKGEFEHDFDGRVEIIFLGFRFLFYLIKITEEDLSFLGCVCANLSDYMLHGIFLVDSDPCFVATSDSAVVSDGLNATFEVHCREWSDFASETRAASRACGALWFTTTAAARERDYIRHSRASGQTYRRPKPKLWMEVGSLAERSIFRWR